MPTDCILCSFDETSSDWVTTWQYWKLIVNHNQNYLGKVMLVLKRHAMDVIDLTEAEQTEFWNVLRETQNALTAAFQPDHFNYAFLMNQDTHVHLHIIPRYAEPRTFAGEIFSDGQLGEHYALTSRILRTEIRHTIATYLQTKGLERTRKRSSN
jgi:diadenosine tetraphosphate (Ap4A) HIT family hydrolase